jgi:hypothetical protein
MVISLASTPIRFLKIITFMWIFLLFNERRLNIYSYIEIFHWYFDLEWFLFSHEYSLIFTDKLMWLKKTQKLYYRYQSHNRYLCYHSLTILHPIKSNSGTGRYLSLPIWLSSSVKCGHRLVMVTNTGKDNMQRVVVNLVNLIQVRKA